jgi:hypothetical protein
LNATYRGHKPRLVDTVTKRLECELCGVSWLRGRPPLGPCAGVSTEDMFGRDTPSLGMQPALRGGLYRGKVREGS